MANISDFLYRIQDLTNKNLQILTAINDSLTTRKEHLSVTVGDQQYVIPSYICLENRINSLQSDFEELVNMPQTGQANITINGNSQRIQLMGYTNTPGEQNLDPVNTFFVENTDVLKDFMTPAPYIHLNLSSVGDNIKTVNVKKITIRNPEMLSAIQTAADENGAISYGDAYKILDYWEEDKDYTEYDTMRRMPVKDNAPLGHYTVKKVAAQWLDDDFDEHYTLELNEDTSYTVNNEAIELQIQVGDWLVCNRDRTKLLVESVSPATKTVVVKVMYGAYANIDDTTGDPDHYTLRYYKHADYTPFKYIDVPLEEDVHVLVFAAAVNDELNIQAPWGRGLYINTDTLTVNINGTLYGFREYYNTYVNNIGDSLMGICSMVKNTLNNYTKDEFDAITSFKPVVSEDHYTVTQINKHLDDTDTVQNIRKLYSQKATYKADLETVQRDIDKTTELLSQISFDDTTDSRSVYEGQLAEYNEKKAELTNSLYAVTQEIADNANNTELPLENAKYHIRGYADSNVDITGVEAYHMPKIIRLEVDYRYKNKNKFQGNAITINDQFLYSDWNRTVSFVDMRLPENDGFQYMFNFGADTSNSNEPSWNQIDIPISQGELVEFKVRYTFDLGWPFVATRSQWSDIYQVEFPDEFLANVEILDIVEENNNDVKAYQFDAKLKKDGIYEHVDDRLKDQDITYFHKADNISSGFYTDERRVIPLRDKLFSMDNDIMDLKSEVYGVSAEDLVVSVTDSKQTVVLRPYTENVIDTVDYTSNPNKQMTFPGSSEKLAYEQLTLTIYNGSEWPAKLFTMFPGPYMSVLTKSAPKKFDPEDYTQCTYGGNGQPIFNDGVWMQLDNINPASRLAQQQCNCGCSNCACTPVCDFATPQHFNQFLYFRMRDIYNGNPYYATGQDITGIVDADGNLLLDSDKKAIPKVWDLVNPSVGGGDSYATLFPYIGVLSNICIDSDEKYKVIRPGESVSIPLSFYYWIGTTTGAPEYVSANISFDFRTSLYHDPVCYRLTVNAGNTSNVYSKVRRDSGFVGSKYTAVVNKTVKSLEAAKDGVPSITVKKVGKAVNNKLKRR